MEETKRLAKKLGLLKKRTRTVQEREKRTNLQKQEFSYLIVIDFESTCWKDVKNKSQEIIEFPAVLINTANGEIESEFHHYVQPQENPVLSEFCRELTGITQNQVEEGIPIGICLSQFRHWLRRISEEKQIAFNGCTSAQEQQNPKLCAFVTWSDWDLAVCLQYECRRKQLRVPPELSSWIDLRATYRKFYDRKPQGLNGALQDLGIFFEGREHSGLDDARNTAKLAWRMVRDGCVMKITKTLNQGTKTAVIRPPSSSSNTPGVLTRPLESATGSSSLGSRNTANPTTTANTLSSRPSVLQPPAQPRPTSTGRTFVRPGKTRPMQHALPVFNGDGPRGGEEAIDDTVGGFEVFQDRDCGRAVGVEPQLRQITSMSRSGGEVIDGTIGGFKVYEDRNIDTFDVFQDSGKSGGVIGIGSTLRHHGIAMSRPAKRKSGVLAGLQDVTNCKVARFVAKQSPVKMVKKAIERVQQSIANYGTQKKCRMRSFDVVETKVQSENSTPTNQLNNEKNGVPAKSNENEHKTVNYPNGKVFKPSFSNSMPSTSKDSVSKHEDKSINGQSDKDRTGSGQFKTPFPVLVTRRHAFKTPSSVDSKEIISSRQFSMPRSSDQPAINTYFQSPELRAPVKSLIRNQSEVSPVSLDLNEIQSSKTTPSAFTKIKSKSSSMESTSPFVAPISSNERVLATSNTNGHRPSLNCDKNRSTTIKQTTYGLGLSLRTPNIHNRQSISNDARNNSTSFKTPNGSGIVLSTPNTNGRPSMSSSYNRNNTAFKTPNFSGIAMTTPNTTGPRSSNQSCSSFNSLKRTPPLCSCGRRAVRKYVQSLGPNEGRSFFTCPNGRSPRGGASVCDTINVTKKKKKTGCQFFKWA